MNQRRMRTLKIDINTMTAELKNVENYIYRSGQIVSKYETLHLQRVYYYDNLKVLLNLNMFFKKEKRLK